VVIMLPVWEATLDEIESKLLELSASQLRSLCEMLMLNVGEDETHTPRALRRRILQHLEGDDVVSLEDEGLSMLLETKEKIESLRSVDEEETESSSSVGVEATNEVQRKVDLERHSVGVSGIASEKPVENTATQSLYARTDRKLQNSSVSGENVTLVHPTGPAKRVMMREKLLRQSFKPSSQVSV